MTEDLQFLFKIQCPLRLVPTLKVLQEKERLNYETKSSQRLFFPIQYAHRPLLISGIYLLPSLMLEANYFHRIQL